MEAQQLLCINVPYNITVSGNAILLVSTSPLLHHFPWATELNLHIDRQACLPAQERSLLPRRPAATRGCWALLVGAALSLALLLAALLAGRPAQRALHSGLGWTQGRHAGWQADPRAAVVNQHILDVHVRNTSHVVCNIQYLAPLLHSLSKHCPYLDTRAPAFAKDRLCWALAAH